MRARACSFRSRRSCEPSAGPSGGTGVACVKSVWSTAHAVARRPGTVDVRLAVDAVVARRWTQLDLDERALLDGRGRPSSSRPTVPIHPEVAADVDHAVFETPLPIFAEAVPLHADAAAGACLGRTPCSTHRGMRRRRTLHRSRCRSRALVGARSPCTVRSSELNASVNVAWLSGPIVRARAQRRTGTTFAPRLPVQCLRPPPVGHDERRAAADALRRVRRRAGTLVTHVAVDAALARGADVAAPAAVVVVVGLVRALARSTPVPHALQRGRAGRRCSRSRRSTAWCRRSRDSSDRSDRGSTAGRVAGAGRTAVAPGYRSRSDRTRTRTSPCLTGLTRAACECRRRSRRSSPRAG